MNSDYSLLRNTRCVNGGHHEFADKNAVCRTLVTLRIKKPHTGMRIGEALALRWRDADLKLATVRIRQTVYASK